MKCKTVTQKPLKEFQPFELTISVECLDDMVYLLRAFNVPTVRLNEQPNSIDYPPVQNWKLNHICWGAVKDEAESQEINF